MSRVTVKVIRLYRNRLVASLYHIKNLYPHCLVLVGSRNGFKRDFTIELNEIEGLAVDWPNKPPR